MDCQHEKSDKAEEWNCDDCSFQGSCASELINHLKLTGHLPSKVETDNRKFFKDFKQCYSCKKEFDGYWNLMTHRKTEHPSNKRCRNFPGSCKFGRECWYVHEEQMETDPGREESSPMFKCNMCADTFDNKGDFMKHRKTKHTGSNKVCENFINSRCEKSKDDCWYLHPLGQAKEMPNVNSKFLRNKFFDRLLRSRAR